MLRLGFAGPLWPCNLLARAKPVDSLAVGEAIQRVPRIPDHNLNGISFLFRSVEEAETRKKIGGTGFLVGRLLANSSALLGAEVFTCYLVSNRHVVFEGSACVATMNRKGGNPPDIWDIDQEHWFAHPGGDDLAATWVGDRVDVHLHDLSFTPEDHFVSPEIIRDKNIGVGDEVGMIGRFVNHQGMTKNLPAVRFGSISVMLSPITVKMPSGRYREQESFAVEMRSRTGFSGSPVTVYRTHATTLIEVPETASHFDHLLGVNFGYILDEEGENTWLNGVVPAWKIVELLNTPPLLEAQRAAEEHMLKHLGQVKAEVATLR